MAGYRIEERRRWPIITASPRGQCSKLIQNLEGKAFSDERKPYQAPGWMKNSSYYIALPHTVASNRVKVSHALYHSAKLLRKQLPSYFNCISVTTINTFHQHNTRTSGNLYAERVNQEFAKRCIRFSVIDTGNKTNTSIISKIFAHIIYAFSHYIKEWILQNYEYTCNINNCYVCGGI